MNSDVLLFGISLDMYLLCFVGSIVHNLMKVTFAINEYRNANKRFICLNWLAENLAYMIAAVLFSWLLLIICDVKYKPLDYVKCIGCGLVGGTFIFNLYPVITNPEFYKSIFSKFTFKK